MTSVVTDDTRIPKRKVRRNYVNNPDFYQAIVAYKQALEVNPNTRIPNYIGECIQKICERLSSKPNFYSYSWKDDMIADGIENCINSIHKFDVTKGENPFAYFSQIAWNAFLRRIDIEKKQQYVKHKNLEMSHFLGELDEMYGDGSSMMQPKNDEVSNAIIENFERRLTKPKKNVKTGLELFTEE